MDEVKQERLIPSFDLASKVLDFEHRGTPTKLRAQWDSAIAPPPGRRLFIALMIVIGLVGGCLSAAVETVFLLDSVIFGEFIELRPSVLIGVGTVILILRLSMVSEHMSRELRGPTLDTRKRDLVEALVAYCVRELSADAKVELRVDFRSARMKGHQVVSDPRFDWSTKQLPDSEPAVHDWLHLRADFGGHELRMRVRSLVGGTSHEARIRDEVGVEILGPGLNPASTLELPADFKTCVLASELGPERARLQFRGRGAGRQTLWDEAWELDGREPDEEPHLEDFEGLEWLLAGDDLVEHIALSRGAASA